MAKSNSNQSMNKTIISTDKGVRRSKKVGMQEQKKYEEIHFVDTNQPVWNYSLFTDEDVRNFQQGTHYSLYNYFGNKQITVMDTQGTYFAVWAP
ncbi:MAG: hypothetical protein WAP48_07050, partial [Sediminibacterium sp.]